jgi:predicted dinucleotide-binding enzyme
VTVSITAFTASAEASAKATVMTLAHDIGFAAAGPLRNAS